MEVKAEVKQGRDVHPMPRVSVIMPAYNVSEYISEALDSVFSQAFKDYEIIVVNDGSPDTPELETALSPYLDRIVYAKHDNRGVSAARNTAILLARSAFVAQLDPDDTWLPEYLEIQMGYMDGPSPPDVLYPNTVIFGESRDAGTKSMDLCPSDGEVTFENLVLQKCTVLACVTARRDMLMRAGLFDEALRRSEDFDMWLRIVRLGGRIEYHRRVLACYRRRGDSLSANVIPMYESILQVLDKAETSFNLSENERQTLAHSKRRFEAMLKLSQGKKAFFDGDAKLAIECLREANTYFGKRKLAIAASLLEIAPKVSIKAYQARDRFYFRANTTY